MRRMTRTAGLGLFLMAATLVASPGAARAADEPWAAAWADEERTERRHEHRLARLTEVLDLTEQQVEQWRQIHEASGQTDPAGREVMYTLRREIRELASAANPDPTAIGERVIEAHRLMERHRAEREALHQELMSILTPDQQERFELMREMRSDRGRHGRGGRHHGSRPGAGG